MMIIVSVKKQQLQIFNDSHLVFTYAVSTSKNGVGQQEGSEQTPLGWHKVRAKIGMDCPINTVFVSRRPSGEIYNPSLKKQYPNRDWILTRILWLSGLEVGKNRLGSVDTMRRYIYIHGMPDDKDINVPNSRGCINMRNKDIIQLFDITPIKTPVLIQNN